MEEYEYNDIIVKDLVEHIEKDIMASLYHRQTKEAVDTKLLELFDDDQRIRTIRNGWCSNFIILNNNRLLVISYNNYDKYDDRPTRFLFSLHPDANMCIVRYVPNPGAYSNNMQVIDYRGHEINDLQAVDNRRYEIGGCYASNLDMSSIGTEFLINLIRPTSIEQIKERARKQKTR
jgi:hypothetical protein